MANILVVEDDLLMQKVAESILRREGHQVTIVKDGKDAFAQLDSGTPYDLVITDILMPYANGYEIVSRVKQMKTPVPVVIVSSVGDEDSVQEGMNIGADGYLSKPIIGSELLTLVRRLLGQPQ